MQQGGNPSPWQFLYRMCLNTESPQMHHSTNHLRGQRGHRHRHRLAGFSRGILGVVVHPLDYAELSTPWCPASRAISTFFSKTLSALTTPFPGPLLSDGPFPSVATERRAAGGPQPVAAPLLEALPAAVHFLVGWMEPGGSARGGGAAGQSPPGAPGISWRACGCRSRPRLSLQRRLLSVSQAGPAAVTMLRGW